MSEEAGMENPTKVILFRASTEIIEQLSDWSEPVQIRIRQGFDGQWEVELRKPEPPLVIERWEV